MSKLVWDVEGERTFETGIEQVALFVQNADGSYAEGVAWSGVTGVTESPSGAEDTALYADDIKYLNLKSTEEIGATIEAYTYPDEWKKCDGTAELTPGLAIGQQTRSKFGLVYKTKFGNDTEGNDHGYKLHFLYNCSAAVSERAYATINDSPEAITFSWEISTTPVNVGTIGGVTYKPTASVVIDSTKFNTESLKTKLANLEEYVYGKTGEGSADVRPTMPTIAKIYELLTAA